MDILVQMKNNFENPEKMEGLKKRLTGKKQKGDVRDVVIVKKKRSVLTTSMC